MVVAPGLALASGRPAHVARVLNTFAAARRDGLIPSHFSGEEGDAEYDSADASLWFVLAVEWLGRLRRSPGEPPPLLGAVRSVIDAYRRGTRWNIGTGADGLLVANSPGRALTWMDAVVDGAPVTPRGGRPVESTRWARRPQERGAIERLAGRPAAHAARVRAWHVGRRFNGPSGTARRATDVIGDGGLAETAPQPDPGRVPDRGPPPAASRAVRTGRSGAAATPFGLRTLDAARATAAARATNGRSGGGAPGGLAVADGMFADAHFRLFGTTDDSRRTMRAARAPSRARPRAGLGSISEMFDGARRTRPEAPSRRRGASRKWRGRARICSGETEAPSRRSRFQTED
jgi:glycogen debranching enzyme